MRSWDEKGFIDVVKKLHQYIQTHELQSGAKLPSERALSDSLQVGRSTVREAFRSLELLGVIETRRGEGTFLSDASNHQFVEILGMFILSTNQPRNDLAEVKILLEQMVLQSAFINRDEKWSIFISNLEKVLCAQKYKEDAYACMLREFFLLKNNRILLKIWLLVSEYLQVIKEDKKPMSEEQAKEWANHLLNGNIEYVLM